MNKIDWGPIKTAYVTGSESYAALSKRFGVAFSNLAKKAGREKWPKQREDWRNNVALQAERKASRAQANKLAKLMQASDLLDDGLYTLIEKVAESLDVLMISGQPCREASELARALKTAAEAKRNLYCIPTQAEEAAQKIAAERLNMDKHKAEMDGKADKEIKVVFEGDWEAFAK